MERHSQEDTGSGESDSCKTCAACLEFIFDSFVLEVETLSFHERCLSCSYCDQLLKEGETCFINSGHIYCRQHYYQSAKFGDCCGGCFRPVYPEDWVRRAATLVFHLACFICCKCKRQLSTGEEFGMLDNEVYCLTHFMELNQDPSERESNRKSKSKRIRTSFSDNQVKILQASFIVECNPDAIELERLSTVTGLEKRVVQVWFQNARARQKKYHHHSPLVPPMSYSVSPEPAGSCDGQPSYFEYH